MKRPQRSPSTISTGAVRAGAGRAATVGVGGRNSTPSWAASVAGDADVAPAVGSVAGDVDVEHDVGSQPERLAVRHAERRPVGQDEDAGVVVAEAELVGGAQHALGVDAEDAARSIVRAVGHRRAERGQRHDVAGVHVERTAPDVALGAVAGVDVHALDLGGVGVLLECAAPVR